MTKRKREATGEPKQGGQYVVGDSTWTLDTPPDEYLRRYPEGPNADLAREVLNQRGDET